MAGTRATEADDEFAALAFEGGGSCPVQYYTTYDGVQYYVRYRWGEVSVTRHPWTAEEEIFAQQVGEEYDGYWYEEEATVYLGLIRQAILNGDFVGLCLPTTAEISGRPA